MSTAWWIGVAIVAIATLAVIVAFCMDTTPTPGSERGRGWTPGESDCPGVPGARAGCPEKDCEGRHA